MLRSLVWTPAGPNLMQMFSPTCSSTSDSNIFQPFCIFLSTLLCGVLTACKYTIASAIIRTIKLRLESESGRLTPHRHTQAGFWNKIKKPEPIWGHASHINGSCVNRVIGWNIGQGMSLYSKFQIPNCTWFQPWNTTANKPSSLESPDLYASRFKSTIINAAWILYQQLSSSNNKNVMQRGFGAMGNPLPTQLWTPNKETRKILDRGIREDRTPLDSVYWDTAVVVLWMRFRLVEKL